MVHFSTLRLHREITRIQADVMRAIYHKDVLNSLLLLMIAYRDLDRDIICILLKREGRREMVKRFFVACNADLDAYRRLLPFVVSHLVDFDDMGLEILAIDLDANSTSVVVDCLEEIGKLQLKNMPLKFMLRVASHGNLHGVR